ncbi:MAG TPA: hypothetical protein VHT30_01355 [Acidimicrobiales bacterium]|jgi:DNA-binding winged helix-turn-helix (wHTH) protein|nr:hypothetical protein [Acidimicrobiales bacterium]
MLLCGLVPASSAGALPSSADAPDSIISVADPGIALHIPSDGRINGDGFAAQVTGYRFAHRVGFGAGTVSAAAGQRLLVFGLQGAPLVSGTDSNGSPTPTVTALLVVDGAQEALPPAAPGGPAYYLASIPSTASDVALQLLMQGFTQTFSFTTGAREGLQPAVLYRTANSWEATDPVGQTITMATPDPAENLPNAAIDVTLSSASLTWFGPDGPADYPSDPRQAWLVLDLSSQAHNTAALAIGETLDYLSTLPAARVTLTLPGQAAPIPADLTGQGGSSDESTDHRGFLGGVYYWPVPADLTTAKVTITPGTITAQNSWLGSPQQITVPGSATFPLSMGAPYQPPPPPVSPPADASPPHTTSAQTGSHHSSGFPVAALIAIPIAVLVLGGLLFARRRTRRRPPVPAFASAPIEVPTFDPIPLPAVTGRAAEPTRPHPAEPPSPPPGPAANGSASQDGKPGRVGSAAAGSPATRRVLATPPTEPVLPPAGWLRVDVLGPPGLWAWDVVLSPLGPKVLEILVLLAVYPGRRFTADQLRFRLGMGLETELTRDTIRRYINELRRLLGDERIPATRPGKGYCARGVTTDAAQLVEAVRQAAASTTPEQRAHHLAEGLSLVRGAPFADAPADGYGWADNDQDLTSFMSKTIRTAAAELSAMAIEAGDGVLGAWAAEKGRLVDPTNEDLLIPLPRSFGVAGAGRSLRRLDPHHGRLPFRLRAARPPRRSIRSTSGRPHPPRHHRAGRQLSTSPIRRSINTGNRQILAGRRSNVRVRKHGQRAGERQIGGSDI